MYNLDMEEVLVVKAYALLAGLRLLRRGRGGHGIIYFLFMKDTMEGMRLCLYRCVRALIGARWLWGLIAARGAGAAGGRKCRWWRWFREFLAKSAVEYLVVAWNGESVDVQALLEGATGLPTMI